MCNCVPLSIDYDKKFEVLDERHLNGAKGNFRGERDNLMTRFLLSTTCSGPQCGIHVVKSTNLQAARNDIPNFRVAKFLKALVDLFIFELRARNFCA
jgi:hypothetical protein